MADQTSRRPNGLDHMGFLLQVVQVVPVLMSMFGLFLTSVWALRVTTAATLVVAWGAIVLLSHDREGRRSGGKRSGAPSREEAGLPATADDACAQCESDKVLEQ